MLKQNLAIIYKSDQRSFIESKEFKRYTTLDFENHPQDYQELFGVLQVFNDEVLLPSKSISHQCNKTQEVVLIPLVGAIDVNFEDKTEFVHIEQLYKFYVEKGDSFTIANPYEKESINYLELRFEKEDNPSKMLKDFSLKRKNEMFSIIETEKQKLSIGIFRGRHENDYKLKKSQNSLFAFVINGAFEFENRLIESRDGLCIQKIQVAEFEALSENAILLILEIFKTD